MRRTSTIARAWPGRPVAGLLCAAGLAALACGAAAQCRQALALGLDVSGSVDGREYRMQLDGLAAALRHPSVTDALLALPSAPVQLAVYEWSEPDFQRLLLDWRPVTGMADVLEIAARLEATRRRAAPPGTGLGTAMGFGAALLAQKPDCWTRTLDISGDGKHNIGPHPREVKRRLAQRTAGSVTLNALVIGTDAPAFGALGYEDVAALRAYFAAWVILGPGAFVETALGFEDYEAAMIRKLRRELEGPALSALAPGR